jgi:hypothetical protein
MFMLLLRLSSMMLLSGVLRIDDGTFGDFGFDLDGEPEEEIRQFLAQRTERESDVIKILLR